MDAPRWARRLTDEGVDPDPRFSFANERTFLAWIRTALALVAAGVGIDAFATDVPEWIRQVLAGLLIVLGGVLAATAFGRWLAAERALRRAERLPVNELAPILGYGLSIGAGLALVLVLLER
jgi:putative membrane protein